MIHRTSVHQSSSLGTVNILVLTTPTALEVNPINEDVRIFLAGKLTVALCLDMPIGLLVEVADGARRNLGPPERFGDVLDTADRDAS